MQESENREPWDAVRIALWQWKDEFDQELDEISRDVTINDVMTSMVDNVRSAPALFQAMHEQHLPNDLQEEIIGQETSALEYKGLDANRLRLLTAGSVLQRRLDAELIEYVVSLVEGDSDSMQRRYTALVVSAMANRLSSTLTEGYLRRAARLYLLGLEVECSVFCRAALESALKFRLSDSELSRVGAKKDRWGNYSLDELTSAAHRLGIIDVESKERADSIRKGGNACIHPKDPVSAEDAVRTANATYALLSLTILLRSLFPLSKGDHSTA